MKKILGGYGGGTCASYVSNWAYVRYEETSTGPFGYITVLNYYEVYIEESIINRGISREQALADVAYGGKYCCDSCKTASWY